MPKILNKTTNFLSKHKKIIKIFFAVLLLAVLALNVNVSDVVSTFKSISLNQILYISFVSIITYFLVSFKWKIILPGASVFALTKTTYIGTFYSLVLPGQLFGEAAKVVDLCTYKKDGVRTLNAENAAASVILDRVTGLLSLLIVGIIGIIAKAETVAKNFAVFLILSIVFIIFFIAITSVEFLKNKFVAILQLIKKRIPKLSFIIEKFTGFLNCWQEAVKRPLRLIGSISFGVICQAAISYVYYISGQMVGVNISIFHWFWIQAILSIILLLPISFGGIGVREFSLLGFLGVLGVSSELAVACSAINSFIAIFSAIIGGLILLIKLIKKSFFKEQSNGC